MLSINCKRRKSHRLCGSYILKKAIDLKKTLLANSFLSKKDIENFTSKLKRICKMTME